MKRGGPLKPGKPLERRTPLRASKGLSQGEPLKRGKPLRATPRRRTAAAKAAQAAWFEAVWAPVCAVSGVPGSKEDPVECHHVIRQQTLRRYASANGLDELETVWAPENGMPVLRSVHADHTSAKRRIPLAKVPSCAVEFAEGLGLGYVLLREYDS